jgi:hypothetical protein
MKRAFLSLAVVGAVSLFAWAGCGGNTSDFTAGESPDGGEGEHTEGGSGAGGASGGSSAGSAGASGSSVTVDGGGPSFDPGVIGGLLGGGLDAGVVMRSDAGSGVGVIPPQVVDGCNALCLKEAAAKCPNQGTVENCVVGCRLILNNPACSAQSNALFACEKTSTASCDAQGKATLAGCAVEQLNAASCFLQSANDPTLKSPCATYCSGVASAKCPNDDIAGCPSGCQVVGNFIPACNHFWKAYVSCASTAMFTCGMDGKAGAPSCGLEFAAYALCTISGVLNVGDAGQ